MVANDSAAAILPQFIEKTPNFLDRLTANGVQKVAGSNPVTPTFKGLSEQEVTASLFRWGRK
jgi:hypothetical protein